MNIKKIHYLLYGVLILLFSCTMLEPENDNHSTFDRVFEDPNFAEGLLVRPYALIPTNDYVFDDVATDDAVTNDPFNSYMRMATGEWSAIYNPQDLWTNSKKAIIYINEFLSVVEEVEWKWTDIELNDLYIRRLTGEAYALRGLFKYYILRNHGGVDENGQLLAAQLLDDYPITKDSFLRNRSTVSQYVESAYSDLDQAISLLPIDYGDVNNLSVLPESFSEITNVEKYNTVFGNYTQQRISGRHARAFKARIALLVASPAFNLDNDLSLWEKAADYHADLLDDVGGIAGVDPKGHLFYTKEQVDAAYISTGDGKDIPEILWRRPIYSNRTREINNFPPSLYGNGRINPSQNLVDAFPMANGYPILETSSGYDPNSPFANRDPRLDLYILYDGSVYKNSTIRIAVGGGMDAVDSVVNSTRTGYYMKKLLREDVNANPTSSNTQDHFNTHIRYTELFLNFAEAANETWGPNNSPHDYTAKEVISALRKRAGILQPDTYLSSISDKTKMRELIHNERRLELCFEGFRFWDLRRWRSDLTEPVMGVRINNDSYTTFKVEDREYNNDYMHYGPIPNSDVIKFRITQNAGW